VVGELELGLGILEDFVDDSGRIIYDGCWIDIFFDILSGTDLDINFFIWISVDFCLSIVSIIFIVQIISFNIIPIINFLFHSIYPFSIVLFL
jgi:hypothetical protein